MQAAHDCDEPPKYQQQSINPRRANESNAAANRARSVGAAYCIHTYMHFGPPLSRPQCIKVLLYTGDGLGEGRSVCGCGCGGLHWLIALLLALLGLIDC